MAALEKAKPGMHLADGVKSNAESAPVVRNPREWLSPTVAIAAVSGALAAAASRRAPMTIAEAGRCADECVAGGIVAGGGATPAPTTRVWSVSTHTRTRLARRPPVLQAGTSSLVLVLEYTV